MSNVLILGVGPLPVDNQDRLYAPGLRTWHFARVLGGNNKHRVTVGVIEFGDLSGAARPSSQPRREEASERIAIVRLNYDPEATPEALATLHRITRFDCVVATTDVMNRLATTIPVRLPLWLDFNGEPFTEKQLQGAVYGSDAALADQWGFLLPALIGGDRFSTATVAQKHAALGQLGFAGRLNQATAGEELVHDLLPCSRVMLDRGIGTPYAVKSRIIPAGSFMALWSGGYNSWMDPETLARGVEMAIERNPNIFFVSTGGEIGGHNTETFKRFRAIVDQSPVASHFHFTGWLPTENIPSIYRQADLALNVDSFSYEGELGHRNRIVDWVLFEVPVATTVLCELSRTLDARGLVSRVEIGDPESLARAILDAAADRATAKARAKSARQFFDSEYSDERVFEPLVRWVESPRFAGDREAAMSADTTGTAASLQPAAPSELCGLHQRLLDQRLGGSGKSGGASLFRRVARRLLGRRPA